MDNQFQTKAELVPQVEQSAFKLNWFLQNGYRPHYYQLVFHIMRDAGNLTRFRHLVAGRRGGKTLSAGWEVAYYAINPREYHKDFHGEDNDDPLWVWCMAQDYKLGRPSLLIFRKILRNIGLVPGVDYKENRTEKHFEFENGSLVEFKSAHDPESLRGSGLDLIWVDEAAIIPNEDAWEVVSPSLADKFGAGIFTTTPKGKNWYYEEFFASHTVEDSTIGRVEYRSIDNPYFPKSEWERYKRTYHPLIFRQEFEASFDALAGVELSGDWLQYYSFKDLYDEVGGKQNLKLFVGVDPAISLSDKADRFAMALIGITEDNVNAYLLDIYVDRIPFPDQVEMIKTWFHKYRPMMIGVEAVAYQAALAQQAMRIEGLPNIVQIMSGSKKSERLLSMAPLFKVGKIKVRKEHYDFIDEWINYDSKIRNPKDDCLDAVEIALRTAGALLPLPYEIPFPKKAGTWEEVIRIDQRAEKQPLDNSAYDEIMGGVW